MDCTPLVYMWWYFYQVRNLKELIQNRFQHLCNFTGHAVWTMDGFIIITTDLANTIHNLMFIVEIKFKNYNQGKVKWHCIAKSFKKTWIIRRKVDTKTKCMSKI